MLRIETLARELVVTLEGMAVHESHYAALKVALEEIAAERSAQEETIETARKNYVNDDLEIDDEPMVSIGDGGVWVHAWVWVPTESEL